MNGDIIFTVFMGILIGIVIGMWIAAKFDELNKGT